MSKMTLTEFRKIKNSMLNLIELIEQRYGSKNQSEEEKNLREYNSLQDRLLSSDLSDIPFEEWQGLYIFTDGELDLSKTHANIDFSVLAGIEYDSINLQNCNIRGIQALDYDENTFDAEYMKAHPEYFPDLVLHLLHCLSGGRGRSVRHRCLPRHSEGAGRCTAVRRSQR